VEEGGGMVGLVLLGMAVERREDQVAACKGYGTREKVEMEVGHGGRKGKKKNREEKRRG